MKALNIILFAALVFIGEIFPQSEWINCRTERQGMDFLDSIGIRNYEALVPPRITFRVYINILRFDDGTGGITNVQMQNALQKLAEPFQSNNNH